MSWTLVAPCALLALCLTGCLSPADFDSSSGDDSGASAPPCFTDPAVHQPMALRLASRYDAASDFFYDSVWQSSIAASFPGCAGLDGLDVGGVVTFTPSTSLAKVGMGVACAPWLAEFEPEGLSHPEPLQSTLSSLPYESVVAQFARGMLNGGAVDAGRILYAPTGDRNEASVPRQLPARVVARWLARLASTPNSCYDAWVAEWEPSP